MSGIMKMFGDQIDIQPCNYNKEHTFIDELKIYELHFNFLKSDALIWETLGSATSSLS